MGVWGQSPRSRYLENNYCQHHLMRPLHDNIELVLLAEWIKIVTCVYSVNPFTLLHLFMRCPPTTGSGRPPRLHVMAVNPPLPWTRVYRFLTPLTANIPRLWHHSVWTGIAARFSAAVQSSSSGTAVACGSVHW